MNGGICRNGRCACPDGFSGSNCQYEDEKEEGESAPSVLLDDAVIYLVYFLMIGAIIIFIVLAYRKYSQMRQESEEQARDDPNKLTSNKAGQPKTKSKFDKYDD